MASRLIVLSDKKGSNPGGKCHFDSDRHNFEGYFKYCIGSKISGMTSFVPTHQPMYEAITFELAERLGLRTVDYFVLLNKDNDIKFEYDFKKSHAEHANRPFYFVSKWENHPLATDIENNKDSAVKSEIVYLDSLLIADIIGKKQNYALCPHNKRPIYIDLGCSFVHAVGGYLYQPNKLKPDRLKRGASLNLRRIEKVLRNCHIIGRDDKTIVNLGDFAEEARKLDIHILNPFSSLSIERLVSEDEVNEIYLSIIYSLYHAVQKFKEQGLVLD